MNSTKIIETNTVSIQYDTNENSNNNKIVNDYYFIETIGKGSYSKVKKCKNLKTGNFFAVKILNKRLLRKKKKSYGKTQEGTLKINYMINDALNEIEIYKKFPFMHNNILKLFEIINDEEKDKTYLIMELAEFGPLVTLDERTGIFTINKHYDNKIYNEKLIKNWILDIAKGLEFLHKNEIVHRDIKSDNIVIDSKNHLKICDFGMAIKLNENGDKFSKTEGNLFFYPPEFCNGKENKIFSYKPVDVWALGVTIYTVIFKCLPFLPENVNNVIELFRLINEANVDYEKNGVKISKEMKELLMKIFEKDPNKRFTAKQIVEYKWLNEDNDISDINNNVNDKDNDNKE
jgi:[calcium/calmodulin-dependent protein kinase] kinase